MNWISEEYLTAFALALVFSWAFIFVLGVCLARSNRQRDDAHIRSRLRS